MMEDHVNGMDHALNGFLELIHCHIIEFAFLFAAMLQLYKHCSSF